MKLKLYKTRPTPLAILWAALMALVATLTLFVSLSARTEATEYSEKQQQQELIRAEQAQAKALQDISRTLRVIVQKCK